MSHSWPNRKHPPRRQWASPHLSPKTKYEYSPKSEFYQARREVRVTLYRHAPWGRLEDTRQPMANFLVPV